MDEAIDLDKAASELAGSEGFRVSAHGVMELRKEI